MFCLCDRSQWKGRERQSRSHDIWRWQKWTTVLTKVNRNTTIFGRHYYYSKFIARLQQLWPTEKNTIVRFDFIVRTEKWLMLSRFRQFDSLGLTEYVRCDLEIFEIFDKRKMFEFWPEPVDGFPTAKLKVDQAYLNITSNSDKRLWLYSLSSECVAVSNNHRARPVHFQTRFIQF